MNYAQAIAILLATKISIPEEEIFHAIETPTDSKMGDLAFPCFKLAKELKKAPPAIAAELVSFIEENRPGWIETAIATGPYVNFFFDRAAFAADVLVEVIDAGQGYGTSFQGEDKPVIVEYSSPNIAKHFHVGHFASTIMGKSLDNIYRFLGYDVTSINHLGDWGTQFGKLITAYSKWGSREEIEKTEIDGLVKLYVKFHEEADNDPSLNDEARSWVVKMQNGNEEALLLWKWFVELSMQEFNRLYERLGISFDLVRGESYYSDKMDAVAKELAEKGLLKESEGAKIVDLEEYGMPPCLILRSDGGTLYPTRDIAAAIDRYKNFSFEKCIYVTANEQTLHFAQWMKVIDLMGYEWAKGLKHVPYGLFLFESGKLSTRRGVVVKIEDLLDEAISKTLAIIEEKNPGLYNKSVVAKQVGIGAIVFNKLYTSRIKDTMFNWEKMLNFDGETGPYVQYTHARACSVLRKSLSGGSTLDFGEMAVAMVSKPAFCGSNLIEDEAFKIIRLLKEFPKCVEEAALKYEPSVIARNIMELAQAFNAFYHNHTILAENEAVRLARLVLTAAVRQVLKTGLELLGVAAPAVM